jgi:hypothetical protein
MLLNETHDSLATCGFRAERAGATCRCDDAAAAAMSRSSLACYSGSFEVHVMSRARECQGTSRGRHSGRRCGLVRDSDVCAPYAVKLRLTRMANTGWPVV